MESSKSKLSDMSTIVTNDEGGFAHAREAFMQQCRPFSPRSENKLPKIDARDSRARAPNPANYDPYHHTRYLPLLDDGNGNLVRAKPMTAEQLLRREIGEAFARETYSLADLTPSRIRVVYRVLLTLAHSLGIMRSGQTLGEITEGLNTYDENGRLVDPWTQRWALPSGERELPLALTTNRDDYEAPDIRHVSILAKIREGRPYGEISLLPPPVPKRWLIKDENGNYTRRINDDYDASDPKHDIDLVIYSIAFKGIYGSLGIERGSVSDPYYGVNGMIGMDDPATIRLAFPTRGELLAFENILLQDTLKLLITKGTTFTLDNIQGEYGFTFKEAKWIVKMAGNQTRDLVDSDVELQRNLAVLRAEDLIRRCQDSFDKKTELRVQHELNNILGITRSEPTDANTDIANIIREWNSKSSERMVRAVIPGHIKISPPAETFVGEK